MPVDVEEYYRRFGPMVLRRCRQLLRVEEDAVDAMHDTFVQILRRQDSLSDQAPSSLLYRTATNLCLNRIRSKRRHPEDQDDTLLSRIAQADSTEERSLARRLLGKIFADEPTSTGTIAVLHLHDGMTLEEVAAEVGLSVSGVRKRLRKLKEQLGELEGVSL